MNQKMKKGMDILRDLNGKFYEEIKKSNIIIILLS
jgi:Sec7-like guanine-nucleotide exchange factor